MQFSLAIVVPLVHSQGKPSLWVCIHTLNSKQEHTQALSSLLVRSSSSARCLFSDAAISLNGMVFVFDNAFELTYKKL